MSTDEPSVPLSPRQQASKQRSKGRRRAEQAISQRGRRTKGVGETLDLMEGPAVGAEGQGAAKTGDGKLLVLIEPASLEKLRERCSSGRFVLFRSLADHVAQVFGRLKEVGGNSQVEGELELVKLLEEVRDAVILNPGPGVENNGGPVWGDEDETAKSLAAALEVGVLQAPPRVDFALAIHSQLDDIATTLFGDEDHEVKERRTAECEHDCREHVMYFDELLSREWELSALDAETAAEVDYGLNDWRGRREKLTPEQQTLMRKAESVFATIPVAAPLVVPTYDVAGDKGASAPDPAVPTRTDDIQTDELTVDQRDYVGEGSFGPVYGAKWMGADVVAQSTSGVDTESLQAHTKRWMRLRHPNILRVFGSCATSSPPVYVCERSSTGNLVEYLRQDEHREEVWERLHEIALALQHLHANGVAHGNLKCSSFVISSDGTAKLSDIGRHFVASSNQNDSSDPTEAVRWTAPECLGRDGGCPSLASDVYSFGMCIIEAVSGKAPWDEELLDDVISFRVQHDGAMPDKPSELPDVAWHLVKRMCCFSPDDRVKMFAVTRCLEVLAACSTVDSDDGMAKLFDIERQFSQPSNQNDNQDVPMAVRRAESEDLGENAKRSSLGTDMFSFLTRIIEAATGKAPWNEDFLDAVLSFRLGHDGARPHKPIRVATEVVGHFDHMGCFSRDDLDKVLVLAHRLAFLAAYDNGEEFLRAGDVTLNPHGNDDVEAGSKSSERAGGGCDTTRTADTADTADDRLEWLIAPFEVTTGDTIGEGSFAVVYKGTWRGAEVAVKLLRTGDNDYRDWVDRFQRERRIWFGLNHPNVIRLFGANDGDKSQDGWSRQRGDASDADSSSLYSDSDDENAAKPFFVCEYAKNGRLDKYLRVGDNYGHVWKLLYEAGLGLLYLHSRGIVHGALKCNDILVKGDGHVALSDFDLSKILGSGEAVPLRVAIRWKAPELLQRNDPVLCTVASDVYAFGMCILEAVGGELPWGNRFPDAAVRYHVVRKKRMPPRPERFKDDAQWELVEKMCCFDPAERMPLEKVVAILAQFAEAQHPEKRQQGRHYARRGNLALPRAARAVSRSRSRLQTSMRSSHRHKWVRPLGRTSTNAELSTLLSELSISEDLPAQMIPILPQQPHWCTVSVADVRFDPHGCIGKGSFGPVYRAQWHQSSVVIQMVSNASSKSLREQAERWSRLSHPNIVSLFNSCDSARQPFFVCEWAQRGSLMRCLRGGNRGIEVWQKLFEVAHALQHLHSNDSVHGNLKCSSIVVTAEGKAKLLDIGVGNELDRGEATSKTIHRAVRWAAPECLNGNRPSLASDVYSFGMCIVEAVTGEVPWGQTQKRRDIQRIVGTSGALPARSPTFNDQQWQLVSDMCGFKPEDRIEMSEVIARLHEFAVVDAELERYGAFENAEERARAHASVLERLEMEKEKFRDVSRMKSEHSDGLEYFSSMSSDELGRSTASTISMEDLARASAREVFRPSLAECDASPKEPQCELPMWHIDEGAVKCYNSDPLGKGSFGSVYRGEWQGTPVVIKQVDTKKDPEHAMFRREARLWYPLSHPNIVNLYGACYARIPFFVCNFAANGRLDEYLARDNNREKKWQLLHQAAKGIKYLQLQGIIHADLKCDNILVTASGEAKITDFGLSTKQEEGEAARGAWRWKAPECLNGGKATFESDVYSFGMCIAEAVGGYLPWGQTRDPAVKHYVVKERRPPTKPPAFLDREWELVKRMCCYEPERRMKIEVVVEVLRVFADGKSVVDELFR